MSSDSPKSLHFACHCVKAGRAEVAEKRTWAKTFLSGGSRFEDLDISTHILLALSDLYGADIRAIRYHRWGRIDAATYAKGDDGEPEFSTYVEFDRLEEGLIYVLWNFYVRYGQQRQ